MRTYAAYAAGMSAEKGQPSEEPRRSPRLCARAPVRLPHKTGCALLLTGRYAASSPHRTSIILPGYGKALIQRNFNGLLHSLRARQLDAPALRVRVAVRALRAGSPRHNATLEAELGRLADARVHACHGAQLAAQADLTEQHRAGADAQLRE